MSDSGVIRRKVTDLAKNVNKLVTKNDPFGDGIRFGGAQIRSHSGKSFQTLLAGGRKLGFKHGQQVKWDGDNTPISNLYLTILQQLGCPVKAFK